MALGLLLLPQCWLKVQHPQLQQSGLLDERILQTCLSGSTWANMLAAAWPLLPEGERGESRAAEAPLLL